MGESTYADKIHTCDSIVVDSVNGDASTGFNFYMFAILFLPCTDNLYRTFGALWREIIQHNTIWNIGGKCFAYLLLDADDAGDRKSVV